MTSPWRWIWRAAENKQVRVCVCGCVCVRVSAVTRVRQRATSRPVRESGYEAVRESARKGESVAQCVARAGGTGSAADRQCMGGRMGSYGESYSCEE